MRSPGGVLTGAHESRARWFRALPASRLDVEDLAPKFASLSGDGHGTAPAPAGSGVWPGCTSVNKSANFPHPCTGTYEDSSSCTPRLGERSISNWSGRLPMSCLARRSPSLEICALSACVGALACGLRHGCEAGRGRVGAPLCPSTDREGGERPASAVAHSDCDVPADLRMLSRSASLTTAAMASCKERGGADWLTRKQLQTHGQTAQQLHTSTRCSETRAAVQHGAAETEVQDQVSHRNKLAISSSSAPRLLVRELDIQLHGYATTRRAMARLRTRAGVLGRDMRHCRCIEQLPAA